jgi:glutamyl-tRNA synthetase/glutamyl-Q tRNA(Asp) synthetase
LLTRFAPAPTGFLHLGHVVNAIYVWGLGRARAVDVLLRIEDHDAQRSRREYEAALLDDLDWLGFAPDRFPTRAFRAGPCESRQSDRHPLYEAEAARLIARGIVYGCSCTRATEPSQRHSGACRDRGLAPGPGLAWRVKLDPGSERFDDVLCGPQEQDPSQQCGDVAIRDRLGNWTYQFVASVDDWHQGVDLIVRGRDLLSSTGRQIRLARLLGRERAATFAHHALIMKSATQKLSKSDGDTGVRDLRAQGWTPERLITHAARAVGLAARDGCSARDVQELFSG